MTWVLFSVYISTLGQWTFTVYPQEYTTRNECNKDATILYNQVKIGQIKASCFKKETK